MEPQGQFRQVLEPKVALQKKIQALCDNQVAEVLKDEDAAFYIPPNGALTQHAQQTFDLTGAVEDFFQSNKTILLLLGESGTGKSFFGQTLIMRKSQQYKPGGVIPLFISLPSLRNPKTQLITEVFGKHGFTAEEINELRQNHKFIFILDAYDEINQFENLYMQNKLDNWNTKIIISCRPSHLVKADNYRRYFMAYKGEKAQVSAFNELYVAPFVPEQINEYIKQYLKHKRSEIEEAVMQRQELTQEWLEERTYIYWIEQLRNLKTLVQTPYLLRITMEVLPSVVAEFQSNPDLQERFKMTQAKLYDTFIDRWFLRQEDKLVGLGRSVSKTFKKDCLSFAMNLAKKMFDKNTMMVIYEEEGEIPDDPEQPAIEKKPVSEWAYYFCDEMIPQDKGNATLQNNRINARIACPLKKVGINQYAFMHASFLDYFVTRRLAPPVAVPLPPIDAKPLPKLNPKNVSKAVESGRRIQGEFVIYDEITREEAEQLFEAEGIRIIFKENERRKPFIIGRGQFGKFGIARSMLNNRFAGVKIIEGEGVVESKKEANIQLQLNGLSNLMPLWYSEVEVASGILYQFMPLAGFGNGQSLCEFLPSIEDIQLKNKFLIHIAKSLLAGLKNMHSRRIYHLDIKPNNFVIDSRGVLYIIDFGCSYREYGNKGDQMMSGGNGDLRYYSPERMAHWRYLRHLRYLNSKAMEDNITGSAANEMCEMFNAVKADSWAAGLSLMEIILGYYPFNTPIPATYEQKLMQYMLNEWNSLYFAQCISRSTRQARDQNNHLFEVIIKLLELNSKNRITVTQALEMPIFNLPENQLSAEELKKIMKLLIETKLGIRKAHITNNPKAVEMAAGEYSDYPLLVSARHIPENPYSLIIESSAKPENLDVSLSLKETKDDKITPENKTATGKLQSDIIKSLPAVQKPLIPLSKNSPPPLKPLPPPPKLSEKGSLLLWARTNPTKVNKPQAKSSEKTFTPMKN